MEPLNRGTFEQEEAVRAALTYPFGTNYDKLNLRLATKYKSTGRSHIQVGFVDLSTLQWLGHAGFHFLHLHYELKPEYVRPYALHELGHVIDENNVISNVGRAWYAAQVGSWNKESFADSVRDWIMSDGAAWPELTSYLLND